jgi:hypothetical protein
VVLLKRLKSRLNIGQMLTCQHIYERRYHMAPRRMISLKVLSVERIGLPARRGPEQSPPQDHGTPSTLSCRASRFVRHRRPATELDKTALQNLPHSPGSGQNREAMRAGALDREPYGFVMVISCRDKTSGTASPGVLSYRVRATS